MERFIHAWFSARHHRQDYYGSSKFSAAWENKLLTRKKNDKNKINIQLGINAEKLLPGIYESFILPTRVMCCIK